MPPAPAAPGRSCRASCPYGRWPVTPAPHAGWRYDHRRTAFMMRRKVASPTSASTRMLVPFGKVISTRGASAVAGAVWAGLVAGGKGGRSATTCTGRNTGIGSGTNSRRRTCLRQFHSSQRLTSCRRATAANDAPGCSTSATIRSFSSRRQRRRRSTPVMISIQQPAPDLKQRSYERR